MSGFRWDPQQGQVPLEPFESLIRVLEPYTALEGLTGPQEPYKALKALLSPQRAL